MGKLPVLAIAIVTQMIDRLKSLIGAPALGPVVQILIKLIQEGQKIVKPFIFTPK